MSVVVYHSSGPLDILDWSEIKHNSEFNLCCDVCDAVSAISFVACHFMTILNTAAWQTKPSCLSNSSRHTMIMSSSRHTELSNWSQ